MSFGVYILASKRNGTLYTGHTDDLVKRVEQNRAGTFSGFTKHYGVYTLVWFEAYETCEAAFLRERRIKEWKRAWKLELIERFNTGWLDLLDRFDGRTGGPEGEARRWLRERGLDNLPDPDQQEPKRGEGGDRPSSP